VRIVEYSPGEVEFTQVIPPSNGKNLMFNGSFELGPAGWSSMGVRTGWGDDAVFEPISQFTNQLTQSAAHDGNPVIIRFGDTSLRRRAPLVELMPVGSCLAFVEPFLFRIGVR